MYSKSCNESLNQISADHHKADKLSKAAALSEKHRRALLKESGIAPEVAAERGYWTARKRAELTDRPKYQRRIPALVIPTYSPDGETIRSRLRPDNPRRNRKNGKEIKYEQPGGEGITLDVHPRNQDRVKDAGEDLWITEGEKKADALTSHGLCAVALFGVDCWGKKGEALPCWDHIALEGRAVNVVFDSDVMEKPEVQSALSRLTEALEDRGASVQVVYLPDAEDGSKQGVDDYLVAGHTVEELEALARPFDPQDLGAVRLSRDERMRREIQGAWEVWRRMPTTTDAECTRHAIHRVAIEQAEIRGKIAEGGQVSVKLNRRTWAELAASSQAAVHRAILRGEEEGTLRRANADREDTEAGTLLLATRAQPDQYEGRRPGERGEDPQSGKGESCIVGGDYQPDPVVRAPSEPHRNRESARLVQSVHALPELRASTLVRGETYNSFGFVMKEFEQFARLGKKRGEIVRYLLENEYAATVKELMEVFAGPTARRRDFVGRLLGPMLDPAIIEVDGDAVTLREGWREALETHRTLGGEQEAARLQKAEHDRQRQAYRDRRKNPPAPSPTPEDLDAARKERETRHREAQARPVSYLAAAMRIYLDKHPAHGEEPANWITNTMWAYGWLDENPAAQESKAAMLELAASIAPDCERSAA